MEKMNENKRNKKNLVALLVLCVSIVALTASLTYAYFVSQFAVNEQEKVTITSGTLALTFRDNDDTVENIEATWGFGDTIEKELIIENTGTRDTYAKISWENLINTYLAESLTYTLKVKPEGTAEYTPVKTTKKNVPRSDNPAIESLTEGLLIEAGKTNSYMLTIKLEDLEEVDQTQDINAKFVTKFTIEETAKPAEVLLVNELLRKTNPIEVTEYTSGDKGEMYTFDHDATEQTEALTDYRFIGNVPNNYIYFNDEMWRIVGVFPNEDENGHIENRVKIMREDSIGDLMWDDRASHYDDKLLTWKDGYLHNLLNFGDYYMRSGDYFTTGLSVKAKSMIKKSKFYLGGYDNFSGGKGSIDYIEKTMKNFYPFERSKEILAYYGRPFNVLQDVGLIYPTDYYYTYDYGVNDECFGKWLDCDNPSTSWIYNGENQWTIAQFGVYDFGEDVVAAMIVSDKGGMAADYEIKKHKIRPTVYLNNDIKILEGDGSQDNPYTIR